MVSSAVEWLLPSKAIYRGNQALWFGLELALYQFVLASLPVLFDINCWSGHVATGSKISLHALNFAFQVGDELGHAAMREVHHSGKSCLDIPCFLLFPSPRLPVAGCHAAWQVSWPEEMSASQRVATLPCESAASR